MTYIHYNPFTNVYFENKELIGALGMTKESGTRFILNELSKEWILRQMKRNF